MLHVWRGARLGAPFFVWSWTRSRVIRFGRSSLAYNTRALCGVSSRFDVRGLMSFVWFGFRSAPPQFFFSGNLVSKFELLINTLIPYKPTTLLFVALATLATFLKVRARSSRALVLRAVRAVCGCQFAVWFFCLPLFCFKRRARVLVSCVRAVRFACVLFVLCLLCARPALACGSRVASGVRFSPRRFALRRLARPSSRQPRPRSFARPRFAVSASLRARARPPRASVLFVCLSLVCVFVRRPAGCASVRGVSFVFVSSASLSLCLCAV